MRLNFSFHPLQSVLWPSKNKKLIKESLLVFFGILFIALSAQLVIPLKPVPLTFQSAAVIMVGMLFGARLGAITMFGYLLSGFLGVPLFANMTHGITVLAGPTAGYLIGFLLAGFFSGYLAQRGWGKKVWTSFLVACFSAMIIFTFGIIVLAQFIGLQNAFIYGLLPFIISEPIKLFIVALIIPYFWRSAINK